MPVDQLPAAYPPSSEHKGLAALCTALAMPIRLQILLLLRGGERSVNALVEELTPRMAQPTVSHHLGLLRGAGLVRPRREGKRIFYALQEPTASAAAAADGANASDAGVSVVAGDYRVRFAVASEPAPAA